MRVKKQIRLEKDLQREFIKFLKINEYLYCKIWGGMVGGANKVYSLVSGFPDVIIWKKHLQNQVMMIELKTDKGTFTPDQIKNFIKLLRDGHQIYVLRPKHWEKLNCLFYQNHDLPLAIEKTLEPVVLGKLLETYETLFKKYGSTLKPPRIRKIKEEENDTKNNAASSEKQATR